jgi:hypothetical protein
VCIQNPFQSSPTDARQSVTKHLGCVQSDFIASICSIAPEFRATIV